MYAVQYLCDGKEKTLLVDKDGFCSDAINGKNYLPQQVLVSEQELKKFLEKQFPFIESFVVSSLNKKG